MQDGQVKRRRPRPAAWLAGLALVASGAIGALAAPPPRGADTEWPCQQRLMPTLGAATFWPGLPPGGDWKAEPGVAALVDAIAPRSVTADAGEAEIAAFAKGIASADARKRLLPLVFAGLVEETNRERSALIERLKALGKRQHELADIASHAGEELRAIPADATGDDAARRTDLEQRVTFVTQAFVNTQRTMRYACDAPVDLEARLGRYAKALQDRM